MAASITTALPLPRLCPAAPVASASPRPRRVDPASGRALELLGHAIEYLTDEFALAGDDDGRLEAIQLLMALNREIYFSCPLAPTLGERVRALLHGRAA